jgi:hypothetical protein
VAGPVTHLEAENVGRRALGETSLGHVVEVDDLVGSMRRLQGGKVKLGKTSLG